MALTRWVGVPAMRGLAREPAPCRSDRRRVLLGRVVLVARSGSVARRGSRPAFVIARVSVRHGCMTACVRKQLPFRAVRHGARRTGRRDRRVGRARVTAGCGRVDTADRASRPGEANAFRVAIAWEDPVDGNQVCGRHVGSDRDRRRLWERSPSRAGGVLSGRPPAWAPVRRAGGPLLSVFLPDRERRGADAGNARGQAARGTRRGRDHS